MSATAKPGLFRLIASDFRAKAEWCYGKSSMKTVLKALLTDGSAAMIWYRLMQAARRWRLVPFEMLFNRINTSFCNCIIGRGAEFGPGFVLVHAIGVVINGSVRGGTNVKIEHQVTVGAERGQSPVLGSDIFIGAGAKIIGPVHVGDGARVGANAVVVDDVPPHSTVVGIPARVVRVRQVGAVNDDHFEPANRVATESLDALGDSNSTTTAHARSSTQVSFQD